MSYFTQRLATTEMRAKSKSVREIVGRQLSQTVGNLISMVSEASSLSQRINENAMGLHIATDFLRDPKELSILDFSSSGRIPISHFSCNDATSMCLTYLHSAAEKLAKEETESATGLCSSSPCRNNFIKIYTSFEQAMKELCDSSNFISEVFRVLLYSSIKGKQVLCQYIERLKPQEINDIITELQNLRRQFDEINILLDRLGWSLADIWGRCTGKEIRFEAIRKEGSLKLKNFEEIERENSKTGKIRPAKKQGQQKKKEKTVSTPRVTSSGALPGYDTKRVKDSHKALPNKSKSLSEPLNKTIIKNVKFISKLEKVLGKQEKLDEDSKPQVVADKVKTLRNSMSKNLPPKVSSRNDNKTKK